jgi:hypothetical protein
MHMTRLGLRPKTAARIILAPAFALGLALAAWGCSSTSGPADVEVSVPTVTGLDRTSASPGDTVTVTGKDFNATVAYNRVKFANALAVATPFEGTPTMLRVEVPANAADGPVSVSVPNQPEAGVGPELAITRGIGDVWVWGGSGEVDLPTPAGAEYLLVPYAGSASSPTTQEHPYAVTAAGIPPAALPAEAAGGAAPQWSANDEFESRRWDATADLVARSGAPLPPERSLDAAPVDVQQVRQFNVYSNTSGSLIDPANFVQVGAELRYTGEHCLVYTDLDTLATGNFTGSDLRTFAETFDDEIYASNTKYFGTESDVDGNGKVIILVTPVVNRLTEPGSSSFIGGFFLPVDLYAVGGGIPGGTTNHAEMFYVLAADPSATWGNTFTRAFAAAENLRTIVHEYQHLISFSYRLFHFGPAAAQMTWLEEGMAHMAEDLLAHDTGDASFNASNVGRANLYLANPGSASLEWDASPVQQRGGIYLFLRLLGDRFGDDIYKQILQDNCVGRPCVEKISGESFYNTVGEFLAALYLSGRGITTDPRYNYSSISLGSFGPVLVRTRSIDGTDNNDTARRAAGDLYRFVNPALATTRFTLFTANTTMGLRTVIVRI